MDLFLGDLVKTAPTDIDVSHQVILACGGIVRDLKTDQWPVLCISEQLARAMLRDEVYNYDGILYWIPEQSVVIRKFHMTLADARQTHRVVTMRYVAHCTFYWNKK